MAFLGSILLAGTAMAADAVRTRVPLPLATPNVNPKEFGIADDTITVIPAEALAAPGVTSGCGKGNYRPDAPLTRRQMAVFLSTALELHYPH